MGAAILGCGLPPGNSLVPFTLPNLLAFLSPGTGGSGAQFTDLTGNTTGWIQANATYRPTYVPADANGQGTISCAGGALAGRGNQCIGPNNPAILNTIATTSFTIVCVVRVNDLYTDVTYVGKMIASPSLPWIVLDNGCVRVYDELFNIGTVFNRLSVLTVTVTVTALNTGTITIRQDGIQTGTYTGALRIMDTAHGWYISGDGVNGIGGASLKADWAAVLFYGRALASAEITQIESWAATYYGVTGAAPIGFNLVIDGNSISSGSPNTIQPDYVRQALATFSPNPGVFSAAYPGKSGLVSAQTTPWFRPGQTNIWSGWEYTNETIGVGGTAAIAEYEAYYLAAKTAGFQKIIAWSPLPSSTINETNRQAYITLQKSKFSATPTFAGSGVYPAINGQTSATHLADMGSDAIMGVASSWTANPTYWYNTVHPNNLGHSVLATYLVNALNA